MIRAIGRDYSMEDALTDHMNRALFVAIDVHGVLCDFVSGFLQYFDQDYLIDTWPKGVYDLKEVTGHSLSEFPLHLWPLLPTTEEAQRIIKRLHGHKTVMVSKVNSAEQAAAVDLWKQLHMLGAPQICFTTTNKNALQLPSIKGLSILIDDCEDEIAAWEGPSILVPRPWNHAEGDPYKTIDRAMTHFELEGIKTVPHYRDFIDE
jgi:hypothetical protein